MQSVIIYTDGGYKSHVKLGAWACLLMCGERSQEILRHAKNNPPVKACRTKEELEEYTTDLLKKWKLI